MASEEKLNRNIDAILDRAVENFARSIPADTIKSNVEFEMHAGMRPRIIRSSNGKCCAWCSSVAGEYYADEAPDDIYKRHDNCNCTVTYISEKGRQDAHTKAWIRQEEVEARRARIAGDMKRIQELRNDETARKVSRKIIDRENRAKRDIIQAIGKPKAKVHLIPKKINVDEFSFNGYHINSVRGHGVTFSEAKKLIQESDVSVSVWDGNVERYYGENGVVYVNLPEKRIDTAFKKAEFTGDTLKVMEVIEKYGLR